MMDHVVVVVILTTKKSHIITQTKVVFAFMLFCLPFFDALFDSNLMWGGVCPQINAARIDHFQD